MENRVSKFEIVLTAVLFVLGCCGIGVSVANRVQKGAFGTPEAASVPRCLCKEPRLRQMRSRGSLVEVT